MLYEVITEAADGSTAVLGVPRGDREDARGITSRPAQVHDVPRRAGPAPDLPADRQADKTLQSGFLREMPRTGIVLQGLPEDRPGHARGEIRLLAMPLPPPAGGGVITSYSIHYTKLYDDPCE